MQEFKLSRNVQRPPVEHVDISDVLAAYSSEDETPPLPCEREMQKMRGELTIV